MDFGEESSEQNIIDWKEEAQAIIKDVHNDVSQIHVSKSMSISSAVFLNIETLEGQKYCVKVSYSGFQIVAREFDKIDTNLMEAAFETPYALLHSISPKYVQSFGDNLSKSLANLERDDNEN